MKASADDCSEYITSYKTSCRHLSDTLYNIINDDAEKGANDYIRDLIIYIDNSSTYISEIVDEYIKGNKPIDNTDTTKLKERLSLLNQLVEHISPCHTMRMKYGNQCIGENLSPSEEISKVKHQVFDRNLDKQKRRLVKLRNRIQRKIDIYRTRINLESNVIDAESKRDQFDASVINDLSEERESELNIEQKNIQNKIDMGIIDIEIGDSRIDEKKEFEESHLEAKNGIELKLKDLENQQTRNVISGENVGKMSDIISGPKEEMKSIQDIIKDNASNISDTLGNILHFHDEYVTVKYMGNNGGAMFKQTAFSNVLNLDGMNYLIMYKFIIVCKFISLLESYKIPIGVTIDDCEKNITAISERETLMSILQLPEMSSFIGMMLVSNLTNVQLDNMESLAMMDPFTFHILSIPTKEKTFGSITMDISQIIDDAAMEEFKNTSSSISKGLREYVQREGSDMTNITHSKLRGIVRKIRDGLEWTPGLNRKRFEKNMGNTITQVYMGDVTFIIPIDVVVTDDGNVNLQTRSTNGTIGIYQDIWKSSTSMIVSNMSYGDIGISNSDINIKIANSRIRVNGKFEPVSLKVKAVPLSEKKRVAAFI